jgi:hypothetical protein
MYREDGNSNRAKRGGSRRSWLARPPSKLNCLSPMAEPDWRAIPFFDLLSLANGYVDDGDGFGCN